MRLDRRCLILMLLVAFTVLTTVIIAQKQISKDQYVVENFQVQDVQADDGSGLVLSWKPLERTKRIIEYRIYRGVSPDMLFFLDAIPVNVKSGVASDEMFYYDNAGSEFIDIASPRHLKKERQQDAKSPLYRKLPRDIPFLAGMADKFSLLSLVDKSKYYYSSKQFTTDKPETADADGKLPETGDTYAGLKDNQQTVLCFLKPGEKYYYTVVAVNERNKYQKPAEITSGTPVPNPPDPSPALYSVVLKDTKTAQFEWDYPLYKDDIAQYRIHQVPAMNDTLWAAMRQNPEAMQGKTTVVAEGGVGSGTLKNYSAITLPSDEAVAAFENARYSIELMDYDGFSSFSKLSVPRQKLSNELPPVPTFSVEDKPNDKGDRLTVTWDAPICFVVKTTALDSEFSKLRVNYQLNKTETQKVDNLYFEFFKTGESKSFAKIKEFYQNDKIVLNMPQGYDYKKGIRVRITMEGKPAIPKNYMLEQDLMFDPAMMTIMPTKELYRNGRDVSTISNVVYRKTVSSPNLSLVKRNTSYDNSLDVTISYPSVLQKPVYGFSFAKGDSLITVIQGNKGMERKARKLKSGDIKTPLALLSADLDLVYDRNNETRIETSLFPAVGIRQAKDKVDELKAKLAELKATKALDDAPQVDAQIERVEKQLAAYSENDKLLHANAIKNAYRRMRYIASVREDYSRYNTYQVVKTDGRGLFVEGEIPKDGDEIRYMKPASEWFDTNKFATLFATLLFATMVLIFVNLAKRGKDLYIRPIAGIQEIDNAIGRATEMGRPMLYCMGIGGMTDVATIASLGILGLVAKRAAEYDTKLIVPCYDYILLPIAQEIVREAHYSVGRPDTFDKNSVFYLTNAQFAYVAGVNGIMIRERMATNFFLGYFAAEALLMTETGNSVGAVQIAGSDAVTQIPFFITTCDYTLIGEELYAASAYLNREPMLLGTLKAQDYFKFFILSIMIVGAVLSTFHITGLNELLPLK
ncbi:MAG: hypothetical protein PHY48_05555 [Candidatus Cloacimonetes bacterium]|nr:hypothetical protein [Candidatus Cloacimonadota bacterium]